MAKLVINPTSASKKEIPILSRVISIGRDPSNDLVLSDSMVSRRHAILEQRDDHYVLRDNSSSNGTLVNGERLEKEQTLRDGDLVAIGSSRLLFQLSDSAETPAAAPAAGGEGVSAVPSGEGGKAGVEAELRCPSCGKKALATDRFCRGCGKELAEPKRSTTCSRCGVEVRLPADFCGSCGNALAQSTKQGQATRPNRRAELLGSKDEDEGSSIREAGAEASGRRPPTPRRRPATGSARNEPAGFGIRLVAALVDTTILGVPLILGALLWISFSMQEPPPGELLALTPVVYSLLSVLYYVYFWGQRGATPGKSLLGLTVRTEDGDSPIGVGRAFLRLLGYTLSFLPFCLGFLWIAFSEDKRGLHDRIAGTQVTRSP